MDTELYLKYNLIMSKSRVLKLLKILQDKTDASHPLNSEQLIELLSLQDEKVERKTVYDDIKNLQKAGYQIESLKGGRDAGYYYDDSVFSAAELRILADAVSSNNFITDKKTDELLEKLFGLTNEHDRKIISNSLSYRHDKAGNEQILYNIDALQKALYEKKAVTFYYFDRDIKRGKNYRKHKERYSSIPYALIWNDDRYYMIGYSEKYHDFTHYRVDRMESILLEDTETKRVEFDVNSYVQKVFQMYSGTSTTVKLRCNQKLASEVLDQLSRNMIVTENTPEYFVISVKVELSPVFYSWLFKYQNEIEIISPSSVKEEYVKMCREIIERYEK